MKQFLSIIFWEFLQNLPLVSSFILAFNLLQQALFVLGLIVIFIGCVVGAIVIGLTEAQIVDGHQESFRVMVTNVLTMSILMILLILYLSLTSYYWWSDALVGGAIGIFLSAAQSWVVKEPVSWRHSLAFIFAFSVTLITIRFILTTFSTLVAIFIICLLVTFIISLVDYLNLDDFNAINKI